MRQFTLLALLSGTALAMYRSNETSTTQPNDEKGDTMSILHHTLTSNQMKDGGLSLVKRAAALSGKLSESFWFCLSFLLFLVMGPFSAVAVIIGLCSLASNEECRDNMVEPASI